MSTLTITPTITPTTPSSLSPILASPIKKKTMSLTQTYYLAHKARAKLSHEAAMPDHNLRLLVGHANLLDSLMMELADAEREQESWFNQSVKNAQQQQHQQPAEKRADDKHIQWADTIVEEDEEDEDDYSDSSSEEDSDFEDEDVEMADVVSLRRVPSNYHLTAPPSPKMEVVEVDMGDDEEEEDDDDEENYAELTLTRSPSHTIHVSSPPPDLEHDSDESSEDESMPPSPPSAVLPTFDDNKEQKSESSIAATHDFYEEGFYLPARNNTTRLVSAISVY